ncbi:cytochrome P450 [Streptomyces durhamensis]|uniref:cytochrome P450 n=1 Tax=Streptomyces durhamensis TaxID=68194 RepID=UPI00068E4F5A|nr:cytochrome P450 [Streptomyces durhamensis]
MTQVQPSRQTAPLEWFDELRESRGVVWDESTSTWYVTRYDDVYELLRDPRLGAQVETYCPPGLTEAQRRTYWRVTEFVDLWPVFSDPPRHTGMRRLLLPLFTPAVVQQVVTAMAESIAATSPGVPAGRLFGAVVRPALAAGLCRLLDEPADALAELADCATRILALGPIESYDPQVGLRAEKALDELTALVARRCEAPRGTLATALSRALSEGTLNLLDATAVYAQLVSGALEPAAAAVARLLEAVTGSEWATADLKAEVDEAADEALRLATPFHLATRRALTDVPLHGHTVAAGSRVVLVLAAANRDPRRFADPLTFRTDRIGARHVAFGRGRHACLGAALTRNVMREMALELAARGVLEGLPPLSAVWNVDFGGRFVHDMVVEQSA